MVHALIHTQAKKGEQARPDLRPGYTVRVHQKVEEGGKQRIQVFEGLIISVHRGHTSGDSNFTVRRIASGIGVEKVFPIHSPLIEKIEVKKVAKVRRAKLHFLRGRQGKKARLSERFTSADEFAVAAPVAPEPEVETVTEPVSQEAETQKQEEAAPAAEATNESVQEEGKEKSA